MCLVWLSNLIWIEQYIWTRGHLLIELTTHLPPTSFIDSSSSYIPSYAYIHVSVLPVLLKNMNVAWWCGSLLLPTGNTFGLFTCKVHASVRYGTSKPCKQMGSTYNTSKENARAQASRTLPLRHGSVCSHAASTQRIIGMPIFIAGSLRPRHSAEKSHV